MTEENTPQHTKPSVALNNLGADHVECGDYTKAIEVLSAAFQFTRKDLDDRLATSELERYHHSLNPLDIWMAGDVPEQDTIFGTDSVIYKNPMYIPSTASNPSEVSIAVVVTFNLAVAYHLASMYGAQTEAFDGNTKHQLMQQALRLYQYTFRLQRTQARSSQSPFFFMACINNIGVLFRELGESHQSEECFNHLLSLLMYMSTVDATMTTTTDPSRFAFFFTNTARIAHEACSIGAAAA